MGRHILIGESRTARGVMVAASLIFALDLVVFLYMVIFGGWSSTPVSSLPVFYWILLAGFILGTLVATFVLPRIPAIVSSQRDITSHLAYPIMNLVLGGVFILDAIFDFRADGSHVFRFSTGLTLLLCSAWDLRQVRIRKRAPGA